MDNISNRGLAESLEIGIKSLEGKRKALPKTFKTGRDFSLQETRVLGDLFSSSIPKREDITRIGGLSEKASMLDLESFFYAIRQLLYNESYQTGNEENTGIAPVESEEKIRRVKRSYKGGYIHFTLTQLCKFAFGVKNPTNKQKEQMKNVLHIVDSNFVDVDFINRDNGNEERISIKLATIWSKKETLQERDGNKNAPIEYTLQINPILCNLESGYGLLPQDAMLRLTEATSKRKQRKSYAHIKLMDYLATQRELVFSRSIETLLKQIGLWEKYQTQRQKGRAIKGLHDIFVVLVDIGQLVALPTQGTDANGYISYTFSKNPNFCK